MKHAISQSIVLAVLFVFVLSILSVDGITGFAVKEKGPKKKVKAPKTKPAKPVIKTTPARKAKHEPMGQDVRARAHILQQQGQERLSIGQQLKAYVHGLLGKERHEPIPGPEPIPSAPEPPEPKPILPEPTPDVQIDDGATDVPETYTKDFITSIRSVFYPAWSFVFERRLEDGQIDRYTKGSLGTRKGQLGKSKTLTAKDTDCEDELNSETGECHRNLFI